MKVTANVLVDQSCMFSFQRVPSQQQSFHYGWRGHSFVSTGSSLSSKDTDGVEDQHFVYPGASSQYADM